MPGTNSPQQRAEHRSLSAAHALLDTDQTEVFPRPAEQLTLAAEHVRSPDGAASQPLDFTRSVAEAAGRLSACPQILRFPGDPQPEHHLDALDRLPHTTRFALLTAAARRVAPVPNDAPVLTSHAAEARRRPPARRGSTTGPCPCECNSGDCCGGCGHAGCGGRR